MYPGIIASTGTRTQHGNSSISAHIRPPLQIGRHLHLESALTLAISQATSLLSVYPDKMDSLIEHRRDARREHLIFRAPTNIVRATLVTD